MSDPRVRRIGEVLDVNGRPLIVGVDYDTVTLEGALPMRLSAYGAEEFGQLYIRACWEAAAQTSASRHPDPVRVA